jgi:hypothetical protein
MRKTLAAAALAVTALAAGGTGYALHTHTHTDQPCTFDGGGTIASGTAAAVSTGQTYFCTDGTLVRFYG